MHLILLLFTFAGIKLSTQSWSCLDHLRHKNCYLLPKDNQCGQRDLLHQNILSRGIMEVLAPRVLRGQDALLGQFPWIAMITDLDKPNPLECGGSLINENYIATAAHCFADTNVHRYMIRLGEHNQRTDPDCSPSGECTQKIEFLKVAKIIIHEYYHERSFSNDIALLRLRRPVQYHRYVSPICMPFSDIFRPRLSENYEVTVAGWGRFNGLTKMADILQTTVQRVFPLELCEATWSAAHPITRKQICTSVEEGKTACNGDSGGPVMKNFEGREFLIGIISFGKKYCDTGKPNVNTRVYEYNTWILDHMEP